MKLKYQEPRGGPRNYLTPHFLKSLGLLYEKECLENNIMF